MALAFDANLTSAPATGQPTSTTIAITTDAVAAVGAKIWVVVAWFGASINLSSVGGGSLTWTIDLQANNGSEHIAIASADAPAGLASGTTITATFSATTGDRAMAALSGTGVVTGTGTDGSVSSSTGGGASWSSGALTTTNADDILIGFGTEDGSGAATAAPNANYNEVHDWNLAASAECWESVYRIVNSATSYTAGASFSASGTQSVGGMVAYKAAAAAVATTIARPLPPFMLVGPLGQKKRRVRPSPQATVATPTTFLQSLAGAIAPTGNLILQTSKLLAGSISPTGLLAKLVGKVTGGSTSPTGTLVKQPQKQLAGATAPAGLLSKTVAKALSGTVTPAGLLVKLVLKRTSGSISPSGTLATLKVALIALAGSISPTGLLTKLTAKNVAGSTSPTGVVRKAVSKGLAAAITPIGVAAKFIAKPFAGSITPSGLLSTLKQTLSIIVGRFDPDAPSRGYDASEPRDGFDHGQPGHGYDPGEPK